MGPGVASLGIEGLCGTIAAFGDVRTAGLGAEDLIVEGLPQEGPQAASESAVKPEVALAGAHESPKPGAAVESGSLTGTVLETMDAAGYTYLKLKTAEGETWAAVNEALHGFRLFRRRPGDSEAKQKPGRGHPSQRPAPVGESRQA